MEKWRLYLILAGILLVAFNVDNIDFDNISASTMSVVGVVSSVVLIILLIVTRKK